ncbi:MAG: hypothetical protein AAB425_02640 [Bdellovibrionota bacterium]
MKNTQAIYSVARPALRRSCLALAPLPLFLVLAAGCGKSDDAATATETVSVSASLSTSLKTALVADGYTETDASTIATAAQTGADTATSSGIRFERASAGRIALRGSNKGLLRLDRRQGLRITEDGSTVTARADVALVSPAFIKAAMAAIDSTSIAEADKAALVAAIAENTMEALAGDTTNLTPSDAEILAGDLAAAAVDGLGDVFPSADMAAPVGALIDGFAAGIVDSGLPEAAATPISSTDATLSTASVAPIIGEIAAGAIEGLDLAGVENAHLAAATETVTAALVDGIDVMAIPSPLIEAAVSDVTTGALVGLESFELSAADASATKTVFESVIAAISGGATKGIAGAGITSANSAAITKAIAFATMSSLKEASGTMTDAQIAAMSRYVTKGIASMATKGGIAEADLAGASSGAQQKVLAAFSGYAMSAATMAAGMEYMVTGATAGMNSLTGLSAGSKAILTESMASGPIAYLANMSFDATAAQAMISAATKGCVAGIPTGVYTSTELATFSEYASKGAMKGLSTYAGGNNTLVASYSSNISKGMTEGTASLGFPTATAQAFLGASSKATVAYAGTLGMSAANVTTLTDTYTTTMTSNLSKFAGYSATDVMSMSTQIASSATSAATAMTGFTDAQKQAFASQITSSVMTGAGSAASMTAAQISTLSQQMLAGNLAAASTNMTAAAVDAMKASLSTAALAGSAAAITAMNTTYATAVVYDAAALTSANSTLLSNYDTTVGALASSYSYAATTATYTASVSSSSASGSSSSGASSSSSAAAPTLGSIKVSVNMGANVLAGKACAVYVGTGATLALASVIQRQPVYGSQAVFIVGGLAPATYSVRAYCQTTNSTAVPVTTYVPMLGDLTHVSQSVIVSAGVESLATSNTIVPAAGADIL